MTTQRPRTFQEYLEEERRRRRIAQGLPPEPLLPPMLGLLAVPTGTSKPPPVPFIYGPNDPRGIQERAFTPTDIPGVQRLVDILAPETIPYGPFKGRRNPSRVLGAAFTTVDPDIAARLQQEPAILKVLMGLPVGAPVRSIAGTAGRGVLTQTGRAARPVVAEAAMRVGQPRAALRVLGKPQVAGAAEKAAPVARRLATEQAGAIRPITPGVSRPATPKPVEIPGMPGEPARPLTKPGVSRPVTPRISRPKQLSDTEVELLRLDNEANQLQREISLRTGATSEMQGIVRPPANAPNGVGRLSEARLRALAAQERVNPYQEDWWDSIDPVAVRDIRSSPSPSRGAKTTSLKTLQIRLADTQARIKEIQQGGNIQAGMGIGERPAQGGLFENLRGEAERIPLADTEQMALRQVRAAAVARGQAEMPVAAAKEPWQMTRREYAIREGGRPDWVEAGYGLLAVDHKRAVSNALHRGLPVPAEVLVDYPDLAVAAKPTAPVAERALPVRGPVEPIRQVRTTTQAEADAAARAGQEVTLWRGEPVGVRPSSEGPGVPFSLDKADAEGWAGPTGRVVAVSLSNDVVASLPYQKLPDRLITFRLSPELYTKAEVIRGPIRQELPPRAPVGEAVAPRTTLAEEMIGVRIESPVATGDIKTPVQATQRLKGIQQQGQRLPDSVPLQDAKEAHIEMGAPDGPRSPTPPRPTARGAVQPPDEPSNIVAQIAAKATKRERLDQTLLRLHEGAITTEARRNGIIVRDGNAKLQALNVGVLRRGQLIPRTEDIPKLDELYNALHNPTKVGSGEIPIPKGYELIYRELRDLTDWEQAARLDFDPAMATVDDYFYRGWKPPEGAFAGVSQGRPLVKTPAFKKPRVDATYQEMREAGFEPLFWNPYQQWGLSRMQGTKYREQMELVAYLKGLGDDFARPHAGGPIPKGWRVPEVGPAFEGKPFAILDAAGEPVTMFTRRWIVPDRVANTLENIYGKRPDLGKLTLGTKTIDPLAVIDFLTFVPKRAKLVGSFFQQVDFLERAGAGSWSRMADALGTGHPIQAVKALAKYPESVVTILRANFSPEFRQSLARQLDSTESLVTGRPGVHLKGISEAGLSTIDPAMFRWEDMDKVVREVAQETGVLAKGRTALRVVGDLESAMRRGLFEGVYPVAMMTDIKNNVAPMVARMNPGLNDAQINGTIARIINIKYSSIPASQSVLQNRVLRETLRRVFFSIGESEGLLRQAAGVVSGPNKAFWTKHWLGTYLFVIAVASVIHVASTGKPLPKERFVPISKDKWGPLPFGYNTRFASPTIPLKGRGGTELTLDVVGQMDTALRVLNPGAFMEARQSVPLRAIVNQASGTDFFGNRIDDVGPGGVVSRTAQLIQDMFAPIGAGGIAGEAARRTIPGAEQVIQEGESRLGLAGLGIQATGVNLRAATREQRLRSTFGPQATATLKAMDKLGIDLGYVTRRFDTKPGIKGGEIMLTSAQREQLQWLTDDSVVQGLASVFADPYYQRLSQEQKKERVRSHITALRARARGRFRVQAARQASTMPQEISQEEWMRQAMGEAVPTPVPVGVAR